MGAERSPRPRASSGRRAWRLNAWGTLLGVLAVLVLGNRAAREHLDVELDLSEDQLYAPSPIGQRMVGELADLLRVKAFFTGEVELGVVQIAKRRLIDQLEEYAEDADGRIELTFADPNTSSEARAEAQALGIEPVPLAAVQGTTQVAQDIWLGMVLRYRGDELALPLVLPQTFEYAFLGAVRKLTRAEEPTVGFLVGDGRGGSDAFTEIRGLLGDQYRLRELLDLETGEAIPGDVAVVVVARPRELHPRVVFALDQFLQRGGRALLLVDPTRVDLARGTIERTPTGLDAALESWGLAVADELVWDQESCLSIRTSEVVKVGGQEVPGREIRLPYPLWPAIGPEGLDRGTPVTAQLPGLELFWAHPVSAPGATAGDPAGGDDPDDPGAEVSQAPRANDLAWSSPTSFVVAADEPAILDPRQLSTRAVRLFAGAEAAPRTVALALSGRLPSPFAAGAPAPFDPIAAAIAEGRGDAGDPQPKASDEPEPKATGEPVLSEAEETQLVLIGDADWATDGQTLTPQNELFFRNVVDWLALERDLLALRSRVPAERKITDFLEEERRALGLLGPPVEIDDDEAHSIAKVEAQAAERAARRRWLAMALATGGSLAGVLLGGVAWRFTLGRAPRIAPRIATGEAPAP